MFARRTKTTLVLAAVMAVSTGCSMTGPTAAEPDQAQYPSHELAVLNHGYALLYNKAAEFSKIRKLLYVKINTEAVGDFISDLGQYGDTLQQRLDSLSHRYPALSMKDTGLPLVEKKKRDAVSGYYLHHMLPLVGRSGHAFDRTLLQTQREELNQARFYTRVLIQEERDANREKLLKKAKQRLDALYQRVEDLLKKNYYAG